MPPVVKNGSSADSSRPETQAAKTASPNPGDGSFITLVSDSYHPLGKQFEIGSDGQIVKRSNVKSALLIAQTVPAETPEAFAEILRQVGGDTHAALMNSYIPGTEDGEPFVIPSIAEAVKRLGLPADDRTRLAGEHRVAIDGREYRAFLRIKENMRPSAWMLIDRDVDPFAPDEFTNQGFTEWRSAMAEFLPGFDNVSYVYVPSSSSRVLKDGHPVAQGNGHTWVKLKNPRDIDRFRIASTLAAIKCGKAWPKPCYSRMEPGKEVRRSLATIFDPSVFVVGRLVFEGKPTAGQGLEVITPKITIHHGSQPVLDTELVVLDDRETIRTLTRNAGIEMDVRSSASGLVTVANDLMLDTELETEQFGTISVRGYLALGLKIKVRCQALFRKSSSFAAFIALDSRGNPFIHDVGANTTHRLVDAKFEEFEPCDYEIIEPGADTSTKPNPLDQYSLTGKSQELEKMAADQVMLLGTLVIMGQLTAFFAASNVGKTLLIIYFLLEAIREGRVKASHIYYINVDDNPHGLLQKLRLAEEAGFHMIADGHQGFKVKLFVQLIEDLIQTDQAVGVVIILDTLKKFTNLMDKSRVSQFTQLCRRFVMKGGTLIALAHTNKHPGADGKPIYAGTSDVVDDFDCAYTLTPLTESAPGGDKVVVFDNIKCRGNVAQRAAYSYSTKKDQSYDALVASVQPIDDAHMLQVKQVEQTVSDTVVVDTIVACIRQGFNKKMALAQEAADRAGVSKRKAVQVLEAYTGTDPAFSKWSYAVKDRGAKVFTLLENTAKS